MLLLLPPSETKRAGGADGSRLQLRSLRFARELSPVRRSVASALVQLARDADASIVALKLGPKQHDEVKKNRRLLRSETLPAADRYTGVLYDALDAGTLTPEARRYLGENVAVHSAVFGPVGALDAIPDYRMSHNSVLPGIRLRALMAGPTTMALDAVAGPIIDARSESYAALGPLPARSDTVFLRIVSRSDDGTIRALNHFNKHAKGELTRALARDAPTLTSVDDFVGWTRSAGFDCELQADRQVRLVLA